MFARFFIERPIFAAVLSIVIVLAGALAFAALPIAQYPQISPPTVQVSTTYPGANATVVEQSVAAPIEEQVNGAEGMLYMSSSSANDGSYSLSVTFDVGRDPDLAAIDVQNRVALAQPRLPSDVLQQGITVRRQSINIVLLIALTSPTGVYDAIFLSNFASINIVDRLARVPGVGNVNVFGARQYGMRIWVDPDRLAQLGLTAADVVKALGQQNVQAPAGQIGVPPAPPGQQFQFTVQVKGRLVTAEEFAEVVIRANPDGSFVRVRDIGRVELGAQTYTSFTRLDGKPAVNLAVYQLPTANALDVANGVRAALSELATTFPPGVAYTVALDTTRFVTASIHEVAVTLVIAMLLVFLVVYVFLQSWRATLIPAIAVPVSLIGTGAALAALGFSINTLTLFGLVLAVGLVVDDAIVVVEAVQLHIERDHMTPKEAALAAMREVAGPVVAVALVLTAVFVPVAFLGGITGQLYKQFALTLAVSVGISALEALTLSPALAGILLRPVEEGRRGPVARMFDRFNRGFARLTGGYERSVAGLLRRRGLVVVGLAGLSLATFLLARRLPTGFVPAEDQGYFMMSVQLPNAASLERTSNVLSRLEETVSPMPGVDHVVAIGGTNILAGGAASNAGTAFVILDPWEDRRERARDVRAILAVRSASWPRCPKRSSLASTRRPSPGWGGPAAFSWRWKRAVAVR